MDFDIEKLVFCVGVTVLGLVVHVVLRGRTDELPMLRRGIALLVFLRVASLFALHLFVPHAVQHADALTYYLPQVESVRQGLLPYRDFASSYGPMFPYLLIPGNVLWPGIGGVALTMLCAEIGMVWMWLRHAARNGTELEATRAAWLMLASPLTWYWTALLGYNNVLIGLGVMAALIAADRGYVVRSVLAAGATLWGVKLLALLAWPAVAWCHREDQVKRTLGLAVCCLLLLGLLPLGMDPLQPLEREAERYSGGNLWTILVMIRPCMYGTPVLGVMAMVLPGAVILYLVWFHLRVRRRLLGFQDACGLYGAIGLVFMILSKKTFVMYEPMFLPFLLHALAVRNRLDVYAVAAIAFLGLSATTQLPVLWLADIVAAGPGDGAAWWGLLAFQGAKVGAHGVLLASVWPRRLPFGRQESPADPA